ELAVYDRALTANEVAQHYQAFVGPLPPPTPYQLSVSNSHPILNYWFNEAAGDTVNHGTLGASFNGKNNGAISRKTATGGGEGGVILNDVPDSTKPREGAPATPGDNPTSTEELFVRFPANSAVVNNPPFFHWGSAELGKGMFFGLHLNDRDLVYAGFYSAGL